MGARFRFATEPVEVARNIYTSGEIPLIINYEGVDPVFYVKKANDYQNDPLLDDLALVVKTEKGLVVLLGCGHRGGINTIKHARNITGEDRVYAVVGAPTWFRLSMNVWIKRSGT
ncbi:MAG: MBL fold metallo-hydrolase [Bacillota bacterium]|nr:MBL fold metallo-hydrolase [Bacillota bacterium]